MFAQTWSKLDPTALINRLARWILVILLMGASWQFASLIWLWVAPPKMPQQPSAPMPSSTPTIPNLTNFKLFQEQEINPVASPVAELPEPDVQMKLEGVFLNRGQSSVALITANGVSRHYRIGHVIDGTKSQLAKVGWDYVTIRRSNGTFAKLKFGDAGLVSLEPVMPISQTPADLSMASNPNSMPIHTSEFEPRSQGFNPVNRAQEVTEVLDNASKNLRTNPAQFLNQMGLTPTSNGYALSSNVPPQYLAQLGLQPTDKVLSVNGQALGNVMNDAGALDRLKQQRHAELVIQRGSQTITVQQSW